MLKLHLLHTMPDDTKRLLDDLLTDTSWCETQQDGNCSAAAQAPSDPLAVPEEASRVWLFRAELARLLRREEDAKRYALAGLELVPKLGSRGTSNGTGATLLLTLVILGSREHLKAFDKSPRPCRAYDEALKFKYLGVGKADAASEEGSRNEGPASNPQEDDSPRQQAEAEDWPQEEEFFSAEEDCIDPYGPMPQTEGGGDHPRKDSKDAWDYSNVSKTYVWASKNAAKAWRGLSKAVTTVSHSVIEASSSVIEELPPLLGSGSSNSPSSHSLHVEALRQQADQGDCSVVFVPPPHPEATREEVLAYLRWAQWSSLRGMPRQEALRRYIAFIHHPC